MKGTTRLYLLRLHSPARQALRLWTGKSLHTLHHCSGKQIGRALTEMQESVDYLQKYMKKSKQSDEQTAASKS